MTGGETALCEFGDLDAFDREPPFVLTLLSRAAPGAVAIACGAAVAAFMLRGHVAPLLHAERPVVEASKPVAATPYGGLFDPAFARLAAVSFAKTASLRAAAFTSTTPAAAAPPAVASTEPDPSPSVEVASLEQDSPLPAPRPPEFQMASVPEVVDTFPMPAPRPADLRPPAQMSVRMPNARLAQQGARAPSPAPATDNRGLFERIFGGVSSPNSGPALAYAAPENEGIGAGPRLSAIPPASVDRMTAVYNISTKTVTLPSGRRLEAHSGLGPLLDDPSHVHVRMHGATPPAVYDLTLREKLFHGVQAIRLTPIGSSIYGRNGILAHTYMLGPNGDSNGCVSFRDYDAFLRAFMNGEVKRLVVVARSN
jgi:hypothetical protein